MNFYTEIFLAWRYFKPKRNAVILNSAAALYVAGKADSIEDGVRLASEIIDSGRAKKQLEKFIEYTNS